MSSSPQKFVVAGAGPVGLVAALRLAQLGLDVTVLEKRPALTTASRASTFHAPTIEIFEQLGILDDVRHKGRRIDRIHYYDVGEGLVADFDLGLLAPHTRFPQRLHLEQSEVAAALVAKLREFPRASVAFDTEAAGVEQDRDGVVVAGRRADALIGADGARSRIRSELGVAFEGEDYASRVLRVMTDADLADLIPGVAAMSYIFDGHESCSLLGMPGLWRIIFRIPAEETDEHALDPATIRARLARFLPEGAADLPIFSSDIYPVSRRVAARYGEGRVLLAGDAAHVTNTRGGMNMNCGISDAMEAADAVAEGTQAALDRYRAGRRAVATDMLIPRTDRTVSGGKAWLAKMRETAADPARAEQFLLGSSMLDMVGLPIQVGVAAA
jgi:2-polyprenyl-6-methoxyphenol hydroxylase-like FAD-dependent oxidoreductase